MMNSRRHSGRISEVGNRWEKVSKSEICRAFFWSLKRGVESGATWKTGKRGMNTNLKHLAGVCNVASSQ